MSLYENFDGLRYLHALQSVRSKLNVAEKGSGNRVYSTYLMKMMLLNRYVRLALCDYKSN